MKRFFRVGCNLLIVCGFMVMGSTAAGIAQAAQKGGKQPETQKASDKQLVEAMHVLKVTQYVLQNADHDYGGHRAAAVQKVKQARKQLRLALDGGQKKPKNPGKDKPGKGTWTPEPQEISNFQ